MMMALGQFVFSLPTLAYQQLDRQTQWRHPSNSRVGERPARQFVGAGDDTITLTGVLAPEFAGTFQSLESLRKMAESGSAFALTGAGRNFGVWVIESMNEGQSYFTSDGVARRTEFALQLARVDDHMVDPSGGLNTGGNINSADWWGWDVQNWWW